MEALSHMITMYDSVDVAAIPHDAQAVAGYRDGKYQTYPELVTRFPATPKLSIVVFAKDDGDCLDIENGDASIGDAPGWVKRQHARGQKRPVLYTSLSNVNTLHDELSKAAVYRGEWRLWSADYVGFPKINGPADGISTYADATQYTDKALGRNLDASLCSTTFFGAAPKPDKFVPADEARWEREFDALKGRRGAWPALRRRVLARVMLHRQRVIVEAAYKTGWTVDNRHQRYGLLFARTGKR